MTARESGLPPFRRVRRALNRFLCRRRGHRWDDVWVTYPHAPQMEYQLCQRDGCHHIMIRAGLPIRQSARALANACAAAQKAMNEFAGRFAEALKVPRS